MAPIDWGTASAVDVLVILTANAVNLLLVGIFLSRPAGRRDVERIAGLASIALAIPLSFAAGWSASAARPWWTVVLPALLVAFLLVELVLDYVLKTDFRHTRLLGPYLLMYYVSLMGMIGYAFLIEPMYGAITLATYFLNLGATAYSYAKVGHGRGTRA